MRSPTRRFSERGLDGPLVLAPDHRAMVNDEPLYTGMVRSALSASRVLKSGSNSKKLGSHWSKAANWRGLPIFSLSLPERTTCPPCPVRNQCYGNRMQIAPRFTVDSDLLAKLTVEIEALACVFPKGFSIRLHALGDFASVPYTRFWIDAVRAVRPLNVFGFTAHDRASEIGSIIERESAEWDRIRIRFSGSEGDRSSRVVAGPDQAVDAIICPADVDHPEIACGSCGICVNSRRPVAFIVH